MRVIDLNTDRLITWGAAKVRAELVEAGCKEVWTNCPTIRMEDETFHLIRPFRGGQAIQIETGEIVIIKPKAYNS